MKPITVELHIPGRPEQLPAGATLLQQWEADPTHVIVTTQRDKKGRIETTMCATRKTTSGAHVYSSDEVGRLALRTVPRVTERALLDTHAAAMEKLKSLRPELFNTAVPC